MVSTAACLNSAAGFVNPAHPGRLFCSVLRGIFFSCLNAPHQFCSPGRKSKCPVCGIQQIITYTIMKKIFEHLKEDYFISREGRI